MIAATRLLSDYGHSLARSHADTLKRTKHANMKVLRFESGDNDWRAAVAYDRKRKAFVLVAGDKSGVNEKRFYKTLIAKADLRISEHLESLKSAKKGQMRWVGA
ncbi:type II toxin-antitoxin system RelE/ParE family toxin [Chelativorans sp. ZYF759]|uniref:type II toxin-antitoxin system RelE/ParE family toxin n=1 Tax=Chelativorans sp. ZYF759 TaxID=2692213 RepID=UPI001FEFA57C|nr:type II toxin-antitoxin system RelE/ParE family toxin [Chelativorans sp. ZYF759]